MSSERAREAAVVWPALVVRDVVETPFSRGRSGGPRVRGAIVWAEGGGPTQGRQEDPAVENFQDAFRRIQEAVDRGEADLGRLGYWKLLAKVKVEPRLAEHWADVAGDIDRKAFERGVHPRFPIWLGNAVLLGGTVLGGAAIAFALSTSDRTLAGIALVASAGILSTSLHDLAHWVVGRLVGIRFTAYFIGGPIPPSPGIKTDYATYLRTPPEERALMHASGAVASKVAPFISLAFWPASDAPAWAAWAILAIGIGQIVTDVLFSTKSSDWKKVRRERNVARAQRSHAL
jgi:hypothetical protein